MRALIQRQGFAAGVDNRPVYGGPADNGRQDRQGAILKRNRFQGHLHHVVKNIIARPDFGDSRNRRSVRRGRGRADADFTDG